MTTGSQVSRSTNVVKAESNRMPKVVRQGVGWFILIPIILLIALLVVAIMMSLSDMRTTGDQTVQQSELEPQTVTVF